MDGTELCRVTRFVQFGVFDNKMTYFFNNSPIIPDQHDKKLVYMNSATKVSETKQNI